MTFEVMGGFMDGREIQLPEALYANFIIYLLPEEIPIAALSNNLDLSPLNSIAFYNTQKRNQAGNIILTPQ